MIAILVVKSNFDRSLISAPSTFYHVQFYIFEQKEKWIRATKCSGGKYLHLLVFLFRFVADSCLHERKS